MRASGNVLKPVNCDYVFSELVNPIFIQDGEQIKASISVKYLDQRTKATVIPLCTLILFHLLNAGIFSLMYDTSGWNSSIQTNLSMGLFQFPVEWNHLQTYLIVVLLQSIGIVFVSSFTLLISSFAKSPITSLSVSLGMFLLPQLLLQIFRKGILNKLLYFFPINNLNAQKTLELLSSEKSFLMSSFIQNLMVVFLFLITLKIIFDFITYRHMKSWHFS